MAPPSVQYGCIMTWAACFCPCSHICPLGVLGWTMDKGTSLSGTAGGAGAPNPAAPRRRSGMRSDTTALMRSITATERAVAPAGSSIGQEFTNKARIVGSHNVHCRAHSPAMSVASRRTPQKCSTLTGTTLCRLIAASPRFSRSRMISRMAFGKERLWLPGGFLSPPRVSIRAILALAW